MNIGSDAISLGPFVLGWGRLSLVLGLLVFLGLVARRRDARLDTVAWQAVLLGLLVARLGYGLLHFSALAQGGMGEWLVSLIDVRKGGLWWPAGAVAGLLWAVWRLRSGVLPLLPIALTAFAVALLPMLLRPASIPTAALDPQAQFQAVTSQGPSTTVAWADLPKPIVVNIWASWCGPCRSEMPLLDGYARQGYPIFFLNASESANTVQVYLQRENFGLTTHLDGAGLNNQLGVRGLPTTVVIGADGKVLARHLGPLDRVQLERLLALTR